MRHRQCRSRSGINSSVPVGLILLVVGGALLGRQLGLEIPGWVFGWEMLLITIGLIIGITNGFRDIGWLIMVAIGTFFLADDFFPDIRHFIWPAVLIVIGLIVIFKPRKKKNMIISEQTATSNRIENPAADGSVPSSEDVIDVTSVFGGSKRIVLSKNFKGGSVVAIFGGSEVNLTQADFKSPVRIEVEAIFGGAKLIVPSNWEVRTETTAILGGIDDKRDPAAMTDPEKVLILEGTVIFGGIEINSY
ncbi:MAG TPA: LiaF domain-containing protein [Chitinophagaceae bacterium]